MPRKRKPKPWHVTAAEEKEIRSWHHEQLVQMYIKQFEQVKRFMRVIEKTKQAVTEFMAAEK